MMGASTGPSRHAYDLIIRIGRIRDAVGASQRAEVAHVIRLTKSRHGQAAYYCQKFWTALHKSLMDEASFVKMRWELAAQSNGSASHL
jgi:hypothetical protein